MTAQSDVEMADMLSRNIWDILGDVKPQISGATTGFGVRSANSNGCIPATLKTDDVGSGVNSAPRQEPISNVFDIVCTSSQTAVPSCSSTQRPTLNQSPNARKRRSSSSVKFAADFSKLKKKLKFEAGSAADVKKPSLNGQSTSMRQVGHSLHEIPLDLTWRNGDTDEPFETPLDLSVKPNPKPTPSVFSVERLIQRSDATPSGVTSSAAYGGSASNSAAVAFLQQCAVPPLQATSTKTAAAVSMSSSLARNVAPFPAFFSNPILPAINRKISPVRPHISGRPVVTDSSGAVRTCVVAAARREVPVGDRHHPCMSTIGSDSLLPADRLCSTAGTADRQLKADTKMCKGVMDFVDPAVLNIPLFACQEKLKQSSQHGLDGSQPKEARDVIRLERPVLPLAQVFPSRMTSVSSETTPDSGGLPRAVHKSACVTPLNLVCSSAGDMSKNGITPTSVASLPETNTCAEVVTCQQPGVSSSVGQVAALTPSSIVASIVVGLSPAMPVNGSNVLSCSVLKPPTIPTSENTAAPTSCGNNQPATTTSISTDLHSFDGDLSRSLRPPVSETAKGVVVCSADKIPVSKSTKVSAFEFTNEFNVRSFQALHQPCFMIEAFNRTVLDSHRHCKNFIKTTPYYKFISRRLPSPSNVTFDHDTTGLTSRSAEKSVVSRSAEKSVRHDSSSPSPRLLLPSKLHRTAITPAAKRNLMAEFSNLEFQQSAARKVRFEKELAEYNLAKMSGGDNVLSANLKPSVDQVQNNEPNSGGGDAKDTRTCRRKRSLPEGSAVPVALTGNAPTPADSSRITEARPIHSLIEDQNSSGYLSLGDTTSGIVKKTRRKRKPTEEEAARKEIQSEKESVYAEQDASQNELVKCSKKQSLTSVDTQRSAEQRSVTLHPLKSLAARTSPIAALSTTQSGISKQNTPQTSAKNESPSGKGVQDGVTAEQSDILKNVTQTVKRENKGAAEWKVKRNLGRSGQPSTSVHRGQLLRDRVTGDHLNASKSEDGKFKERSTPLRMKKQKEPSSSIGECSKSDQKMMAESGVETSDQKDSDGDASGGKKKKICRRSLLHQIANSEGYVADKLVKKPKCEDLFTDSSLLSREERALQMALMRITKMEIGASLNGRGHKSRLSSTGEYMSDASEGCSRESSVNASNRKTSSSRSIPLTADRKYSKTKFSFQNGNTPIGKCGYTGKEVKHGSAKGRGAISRTMWARGRIKRHTKNCQRLYQQQNLTNRQTDGECKSKVAQSVFEKSKERRRSSSVTESLSVDTSHAVTGSVSRPKPSPALSIEHANSPRDSNSSAHWSGLSIPHEVRKLMIYQATGETVLHKGARLGYEDVVRWCCKTNFVNVNARDNAGYTPLHGCCISGHVSIARCLLMYGADVNAASRLDGARPIHDAVESDNIEMVRLLLSAGADINLSTYSGKTVDSLACSRDMREFLQAYLLDLNGRQQDDEFEDEWHFLPPWIEDLKNDDEKNCDILANLPPELEDERESQQVIFECSEKEFLPLYLSHVDGHRQSSCYLLLSSVLDQVPMSRENFVAKFGSEIVVHKLTPNSNVPTSTGGTHKKNPDNAATSVDLVRLGDKARRILNISVDVVPWLG